MAKIEERLLHRESQHARPLLASWTPGAFVFKSLNTTGAINMGNAADYPVKPLILVAGDNGANKAMVMELIGKLGFDSVRYANTHA